MAKAGTPKTRLVGGERVDIKTNQPIQAGQPYPSALPSNFQTPTSIGANDIGTQGLQVPDRITPTGAEGLGVSAMSFAEQARATNEAKLKEAEKSTEQGESRIRSLINSIGNVGKQKADALEDSGANQLQEDVDSIISQMEAADIAATRKVERIEENRQGLFGGAVEDEVYRVQKENARHQADLAITLAAKSRALDTATSIINQRTEALTEELKLQLESEKYFYENNKQALTQAEQRQYEGLMQQDQRQYEASVNLEQQKGELMLSATTAGAPQSVINAISNASTIGEALNAGGGYIGLLERQSAQRASASASLARRKDLLQLALAGDPQAVTELGYDPNNLPMTQEQLVANEESYIKNQEDIGRVTNLIENDRGLQLSSGNVRGGWSVATQVFNPAGGVARIPDAISSKNDFLSDASYIINNLTLDKFVNLKAAGATFGALSEGEWRIIGSSANELASMAIKDETGTLIGFRGSEQKVRDELAQIKTQYQKALDKNNAQGGLNKTEQKEVSNIYYGSQ